MSEDINQESISLNEGSNGEKKEVNRSKLLILILLSILFLVVLVYVFTGTSLMPKDFKLGKLDLGTELVPEGEIYLTLSPVGLRVPDTNIYKLDLSSGEIGKVFEDADSSDYMGKLSSDGKQMVLTRRHSDFLSQVVLVNMETEEVLEVTPRSIYFPRNAVFSPDNQKVAYWVYEERQNPFGFGDDPEEHSIYVASVYGDIEKIADGAFPVFSPDGKFILFLKDDGLYTINLSNKSETKVMEYAMMWSADDTDEMLTDEDVFGFLWLSIRFNVSWANNLLLFTDSVTSEGSLFKINSWSPFTYEEIATGLDFQVPIWPIFSPDGAFFAIQRQGVGAEVAVFSTEDLELKKTFELNEYEPLNIWITDWLIK